jgi:autotransporter translocation and assembly factor TamB
MTQEELERLRERHQTFITISQGWGSVLFVPLWSVVIAAVLACGIIGLVVYTDPGIDYFREARDSWLTECQIKGRSLEDCASVWDDGSTLRQVYYDKVREGR